MQQCEKQSYLPKNINFLLNWNELKKLDYDKVFYKLKQRKTVIVIFKKMGNCVTPSCIQGRKNKYQFKMDKYDQVPEDTQNFKHLNVIKRPYSALLANVKVKKCPYKSIGIKISIDYQQYYKLGNKPVSQGQDVKWKFQKRLDFMKTDYEIRKAFLVVHAIDQGESIVGSLKINLYLICTGPYHQDFMMEFKNGKIGRISFDFKVSQLIELSLQSLQAEINLLKKHPGENFAFSIKTIVGSDTKVSKSSYPVQVVLDQKLSNKYLQSQKTRKLPRRRSSNNLQQVLCTLYLKVKQLQQNNNLLWRKTQCQQMPSISMRILLNQLHHAYFQILLIKYTQTIQTSTDSQQQQKPQTIIIREELFAECYISFHKLFTKEPEMFERDGLVFQKRNIELSQKIEIHGREFGKARLVFYMENEKYIKQMQVCVRTEEGVSKTSPVFGFDDVVDQQNCKQVQLLRKLSSDLQLNIIKLQQCQTGYLQMRRLKQQTQAYLSQMLPLLQKTSKQSMILYSYSNQKQLIQAQKTLIQLGDKVASYVEEQDQMIGELCWLVLIALIKRGEFRLSNIGFNERERKEIEDGKISKYTKKKVEVALQFQQFMYKLLKIALESLNYKGSETQRAFAQIFCAYAYFRIPNFRNQMLSVISQNDQDVPEWRGIEFSLNEDVDYTVLRQDVDSFTALFDWEHGFHRCLEKFPKNQQKNDAMDLNQILSNQYWKNRFQRRGPAFFSFVKYWVGYVEGLIVKSRDIQWKYFPGYNRLLKVFFLELKGRKILQYPDSLKQTAHRLVANQKIFSIIVYILLNKANLHQPLAVIKAIQMISDLLQALKSKNKSVPALFHYAHFFKAIQLILQSQFLFMLQATLILLYTHFDLFHYEFRKNLCIYFLRKVFFKLFFHWSSNVRNVFHHILVYRIDNEIYHQILKDRDSTEIGKVKKDYIETIRELYCNTMAQLEKIVMQKSIKNQKLQLSTKKGKKVDKELYLVMKKKLIQKKLSKAKKQLLQPKSVSQLIIQFPQSDNQNNPQCVEKRRKHALLHKPSYDEALVQPRVDRTQSQIVPQSKVAVVYKNYRLQKKEQQVIELNKQNSIKIKNEILDTTQVREDGMSIDKMISSKRRQLNPIFNVFQELSTQLTPITQGQSQYIQKSMATFDEIKNVYSSGVMLGKCDVPLIKRQEVAVDQKEIRPEKIDDW